MRGLGEDLAESCQSRVSGRPHADSVGAARRGELTYCKELTSARKRIGLRSAAETFYDSEDRNLLLSVRGPEEYLRDAWMIHAASE